MFSQQEQNYLRTQLIARLATVATDGQPIVDAVSFEFDGSRFYIGGHRFQHSRKYKNVVAGNTKVSLIIDDLKSVQPWVARGIRINGIAEPVEREGRFGHDKYLAITPKVSWSWGIEEPAVESATKVAFKKTVW